MKINVTLHGILRDSLPRQAKGKTTLTLAEGATVADVMQELGLKQTVTAAINGTQVEADHILQKGDNLQLFRVVGGG
jgi:sulfur carrier protein ThiS